MADDGIILIRDKRAKTMSIDIGTYDLTGDELHDLFSTTHRWVAIDKVESLKIDTTYLIDKSMPLSHYGLWDGVYLDYDHEFGFEYGEDPPDDDDYEELDHTQFEGHIWIQFFDTNHNRTYLNVKSLDITVFQLKILYWRKTGLRPEKQKLKLNGFDLVNDKWTLK